MSFREWVTELKQLHADVTEMVRLMTRRAEDDELKKHPREAKALVELRDAANLIGASLLFVLEDIRIREDDTSLVMDRLPQHDGAITPGGCGLRFEIWATARINGLAGLFCTKLRLHWLSTRPELLPHRHWMVMQALGAAFAKILVAGADMATARGY